MLPDIENLLKLQDADKEIRRLREEIAELPKRVEAIEQKLAGTKAQLERAQASVKGDEAARRKHETSIQDLRGRISKYRDQSLEVKTNDQYKALLHEIQFAEGEIAAAEDKILELMLNTEAREKEVKLAQAELKAETAEIEREKADAHQRTAEDQKQLTEWRAKRDQLRVGIDADLLRHYERVAKFRGTGIAEAFDHKCATCQVLLRPQTYNEVRTGQHAVVCDSCQRILYFNPAHELAANNPVAVRPRRHHPKMDAKQAWYYRGDYGEAGETYLCFIKNRGQSARRVYDVHNGRQVGDVFIREGEYHAAFPEDLADAIRLNGSWDEAELEAWGTELPMVVLDALQADLEAARAEASAAASHTKRTAPATTEQAAS
jgi:predicted  nucleic acid-binding Zn-ribbon protein